MPMLVFVCNWTLILSMNVLILSNKSVIYTKSVQIRNFFPFLSSIIEWYRRHLISRQYFIFPRSIMSHDICIHWCNCWKMPTQFTTIFTRWAGQAAGLHYYYTHTHIRTHTQINTPDNAHHINWLVWIIEFWWICHIQYMYTISIAMKVTNNLSCCVFFWRNKQQNETPH